MSVVYANGAHTKGVGSVFAPTFCLRVDVRLKVCSKKGYLFGEGGSLSSRKKWHLCRHLARVKGHLSGDYQE
eukprot:12902708-Prorocentrum_lima.AAC.1